MIFNFEVPANHREYQPEFAVVFLGELNGVLFDTSECLERILLAQVCEYLDFNDSESIFVFKLLLDSCGPFLSTIFEQSIIIPLFKTFEFSLNKDESSNNINLVVNVINLERSDSLRLHDLKIDVSAAQCLEDV